MPICTYCDAPTDDPVTADDVEGVFCCSGCLEAHRVADEASRDECCHHGDGHGHGPEARGPEPILIGLINPLFAALAMAASSLGVVGNSARPLPLANPPG